MVRQQRRACGPVRASLALPILVAALLIAPPTSAQETPVMDEMIGAWVGSGTLFGADATFTMKWEWALGERFVRLTFQNRMVGADGVARGLDAEAFYQPMGEGRFEGTWFDTRGMVLRLSGTVEERTLTTLWGSPETEQGRTVYRLLEENRMEVEDWVLSGDQWSQFGHATYSRATSADDPSH